MKLSGSSIMEVIIALAICLIIFFISIAIISRSYKDNNVILRYKANFILSNITDDNFEEYEGFDKDGIKLSVKMEESDTIQNIATVKIYAHSYAGKLIGKKVFLINGVKEETPFY